jgi:hypothetical protein
MAQDGGCEYSFELEVLSSEFGPNLNLYTQSSALRRAFSGPSLGQWHSLLV